MNSGISRRYLWADTIVALTADVRQKMQSHQTSSLSTHAWNAEKNIARMTVYHAPNVDHLIMAIMIRFMHNFRNLLAH